MSFLRNSEVYAIINSFWNVYCLLDLLMSSPFSTACCAGIANHLTNSVAIPADLLNHEWALPDCLETSTSACSTFCTSSPWLCFASLTSAAEVCSAKLHGLLSAIYRVHEVNLNCQDDVFAALRRSLLLTSLSSLTTSSKKLLKLFKDVSKRRASLLTTLLSELVMEPFETRKTTKSLSKPSKWITTSSSLLLLIPTHSSLVINSFLLFIS